MVSCPVMTEGQVSSVCTPNLLRRYRYIAYAVDADLPWNRMFRHFPSGYDFKEYRH